MSEAEFGIVMPFICVQSVDGPYEDRAFAAGYQMGLLDRTLARGLPFPLLMTIPTDLIEQADLIAMRYGCTTQHAINEELPEWTSMSFTPIPQSDGLPELD